MKKGSIGHWDFTRARVGPIFFYWAILIEKHRNLFDLFIAKKWLNLES